MLASRAQGSGFRHLLFSISEQLQWWWEVEEEERRVEIPVVPSDAGQSEESQGVDVGQTMKQTQ